MEMGVSVGFGWVKELGSGRKDGLGVEEGDGDGSEGAQELGLRFDFVLRLLR
jgi:hypothetical protein